VRLISEPAQALGGESAAPPGDQVLGHPQLHATFLLSCPLAQASMILARSARACALLARPAHVQLRPFLGRQFQVRLGPARARLILDPSLDEFPFGRRYGVAPMRARRWTVVDRLTG